MPGNERIDSIIDLAAITAEAKATEDLLTRLKELIVTMPQMFKDYKGSDGLGATREGTEKLTAAMKQMLQMQRDLDTQRAKSLTLESDIAQQLANQKAINAQKIKDMQAEAKEATGLNNAYQQLTLQYQQALKTAQIAGAQNGVMSKQFQEAAVSVNLLRGQLNTIDYSLGNYQKNVGNYNGALNTLAKSVRGMGGLGVILSRALGIDPSVAMGIRETGMALRDLKHAKDIENLSEKEGAVATNLNAVATQKAGIIQRAYTAIVGESTGVMKAFKLAMAATGIGALLLLIPAIAAAIEDYKAKLTGAALAQKDMNDIMAEGSKNSAEQVAKVQELYAITQDVTQSIHTRKEATDELVKINNDNNEKTGQHTKLLTDQNGILKTNKEGIDALTKSLLRQAVTKAALGKIEETFKKILEAQTGDITENLTFWDKAEATFKGVFSGQMMAGTATALATTGIQRQSEAVKQFTNQYNTLKQIFATGLKDGTFSLDGIFDDGKNKGGGKSAIDTYLKDFQKAVDETAKIRRQAAELELKDQVDLFKEEAEDEKNSFSTRIVAYSEFLNKSKDLLKQQMDDETKDAQAQIKEEKTAVQEKLKEKGLTVTQRKNLNAELKALDEKLLAEELLIQEKYNLGVQKVQDETIKKVESLIDKEGVHAPDFKEMSKGWDQAAKNINNKILEHSKAVIQSGVVERDQSKKTKEQRIKDIEFWANASKQAITVIADLFEAGIDRQKNAVQDLENSQQLSYENEVTRINASSMSDQQKSDKLKTLEAERAAQKENNDRKQRELDQKKARFDKAKTIADIIESTALAVIKTIAAMPGPAGIAEGIAVGAIGAAQLAVAVATPIPKYQGGTESAKGGLAWTDEAGPELYIHPDGKMYLGNDKPTLRYLPRGAKVIPHDEMMNMMASGAISNSMSISMNDGTAGQIGLLRKDLRENFMWQTKELKQPNKKPVFNITLKGDFKNSDHIQRMVYK